MAEIRNPQQLRSIETKKKIIESGFDLFSKNGYYKTNTAQIAKYAGVSTGIVYGYFKNKKDILLEVMNIYTEKTYNPIFDFMKKYNCKNELEDFIFGMLTLAEKIHIENYSIHKELNSIAQTDEQINKAFIALQDKTTEKVVKKLKEIGYSKANNENVHISMNLIQTYVHEAVYDKHEYMDYKNLKYLVVKLIKSLFE